MFKLVGDEVKSIKELAEDELRKEAIKEATGGLKALYKKLKSAEKLVRNVEREIEDYCEEFES